MINKVQRYFEASLVVLVPEIESVVGAFRKIHDPSAAAGMPAHITINYPFLPGVNPEPGLNEDLGRIFSECKPIPFAFTRLARFPDVLYLRPEPDKEFKRLIELVARRFPESPPYGETIGEIVPHLTIAQKEEDRILRSAASQLIGEIKDQLPIMARAEKIWLMDKRSGAWEVRETFPLGGSDRVAA